MTDRGQKHKAKFTGIKKRSSKRSETTHFPIIINSNKKWFDNQFSSLTHNLTYKKRRFKGPNESFFKNFNGTVNYLIDSVDQKTNKTTHSPWKNYFIENNHNWKIHKVSRSSVRLSGNFIGVRLILWFFSQNSTE